MTIDPPRASMRNPGIDLLRGLAILLVILVHLRIRIPVKDSLVADILPHWLVKALTDRGHEAVYVFFVISGFLITLHALMRWRELHQMDVLAFWARRAARILPCLLVLIAVLSVLHLLNVQGYAIWREGQSLWGAVVAALVLSVASLVKAAQWNPYWGFVWYLPAILMAWGLGSLIERYLSMPSMKWLLRKAITDGSLSRDEYAGLPRDA